MEPILLASGQWLPAGVRVSVWGQGRTPTQHYVCLSALLFFFFAKELNKI